MHKRRLGDLLVVSCNIGILLIMGSHTIFISKTNVKPREPIKILHYRRHFLYLVKTQIKLVLYQSIKSHPTLLMRHYLDLGCDVFAILNALDSRKSQICNVNIPSNLVRTLMFRLGSFGELCAKVTNATSSWQGFSTLTCCESLRKLWFSYSSAMYFVIKHSRFVKMHVYSCLVHSCQWW